MNLDVAQDSPNMQNPIKDQFSKTMNQLLLVVEFLIKENESSSL